MSNHKREPESEYVGEESLPLWAIILLCIGILAPAWLASVLTIP